MHLVDRHMKSIADPEPPRRISAVRDVVIPLGIDDVLAVVRDIALLEPLERKARSVQIYPLDAEHGWYRIVG